MVGRWPEPTVDHRNRVRDDNRWENLREATYEEQCNNRELFHEGKPIGVGDGVYYRPDRGKWRARTYTKINGKKVRITIGQFNTEQEALAAYKSYRERVELPLPTGPSP